jgi:hypothetical protein
MMMDAHQVVDVSGYLPGNRRGPILIGGSAAKEQNCGCLQCFMPQMPGFAGGPVTIMCDKHELGQLLAEERVRLEKAWAARGP